MPRPRNPGNEAQRAAQQRYRERLRGQRRPEADAVDSALSVAVAIYRHTAEQRSSDRDIRRAGGFEVMAINYLISRGYAPAMATRQVRRRVRRLDIEHLIPLVSGSPEKGVLSSSRV